MNRSAVIVLLLLAMGWQALALAKGGATVNALLDFGHAVLHWNGQHHHHHADGSYHLGTSEESARHLLADQTGSTALPPADTPALLLGARAQASAPAGPAWAQPYPDGPLRPPRLSA